MALNTHYFKLILLNCIFEFSSTKASNMHCIWQRQMLELAWPSSQGAVFSTRAGGSHSVGLNLCFFTCLLFSFSFSFFVFFFNLIFPFLLVSFYWSHCLSGNIFLVIMIRTTLIFHLIQLMYHYKKCTWLGQIPVHNIFHIFTRNRILSLILALSIACLSFTFSWCML